VDVPAPRPDDVLAQPTRARLFALLGELKRPAPTEELAELVGLHVNGVRAHLERLQTAGLVTRARARRPVGRPRDEWVISPDARPGGDPPHAYADLGRWLARAIRPDTSRLHDVETIGREIGRELAPHGGSATADAMQTTLAAMGFAPDVRHGGDQRVVYCLRNCPYRVAARENQPLVCTLHRGLTQGLLDVVQPAARLADFVPNDPDSAGCIIDVITAEG
jgi:predicted ArsR family transcriptional regulator